MRLGLITWDCVEYFKKWQQTLLSKLAILRDKIDQTCIELKEEYACDNNYSCVDDDEGAGDDDEEDEMADEDLDEDLPLLKDDDPLLPLLPLDFPWA